MRLRALLAVSALAVSLAGCAEDPTRAEGTSAQRSGDETSAPSASPSPSEAESPRPSVDARPKAEPKPAVPETLEFTTGTVDGAEFDGATLVGKPTLLWFWAPWCPTCRGQISEVRDIAAAHSSDANVVGVGSLDDAEAIAAFAGDADGITHLSDEDGVVWRKFGIVEQSSFVLLDEEGQEVYRAGYGGEEGLAERVADLTG